MIDKSELLRWLNWLERQIDYTSHTENTKNVHRGYCDVFRQHVIAMPEVKPKDNWGVGYTIGVIAGVIFTLIGLNLFGKI